MNLIEPHVMPHNAFLVVPVLPGKTEAWRRFVQELQGPQRQAWAAWRGRLGLHALRVWVQSAQPGAALLIQASLMQPPVPPHLLIDGQEPFDRWLREQVIALHGLDLAQFRLQVQWELILETLEAV